MTGVGDFCFGVRVDTEKMGAPGGDVVPHTRSRWNARRNLVDIALYRIGLMALEHTQNKLFSNIFSAFYDSTL